ncbi:EAL domain-containing protein [Alcaligenaceae bacterium CGII-47]|nr:EAL domain-containing protein [Alcaligenaceae bacterium CGII-47]
MHRVLPYLYQAFLLFVVLALPPTANAVSLRVGVPDLQPDIYLQADGRPGGILGEILNEIALREEWVIEAQPCLWADCMRLVQSGAIDLLPDVTYTPERSQILDFHQIPVLFRTSHIYVHEDTSVSSLSDLAGKRIAVLTGSLQYSELESLLSQQRVEAQLVEINRLEEGFRLVSQGQADAVVADYFVGALYAPKYQLIDVPITFNIGKIFYASAPGNNPEVLAVIDHYLQAWKADPQSIYFQILSHWGYSTIEAAAPWYSNWKISMVLLVLLMLITAFAWYQWGRSSMLFQRLSLSTKQIDVAQREHDDIREQIRHATFFDILTDLPNLPLLIKRIEQALTAVKAGETIAAVVALDVDGFRKINEAHGRAVGDLILQEIAKRLVASTRARDTVSRTNSDEFKILLTGLGVTIDEGNRKAMKVAEKLRRALNTEPLIIGGKPYTLRVSIGLAVLCEDDQSIKDVLRKADLAMHHAEELGGNRVVFFNHDIQEQVEYRLTLERDLVLAIKSAQIRLHIQPQYSSDGQVSGAELLARWAHPTYGAIPPAVFIPLAREGGLLRELTGQILVQACEAVQVLQRHGETYPISLNVSPETLADPLFIQTVHKTLNRAPTTADHLIFEMTEEIRADGMDVIVQHMHELNASGIRFSIDDFGTGYSNLAYLNRLPIHELKIDKSLIDGIPHRHDSIAIIQLILTLAQKLSLRIVAEGVESQPQADFLFRHRCNAIQGYLMARPIPIDDWLDRHES